ncbi:MAG: CRP-like cAMP-binding protein [Oceanicoccus sp.]|jgi:CRP-like cAMP-binding protein
MTETSNRNPEKFIKRFRPLRDVSLKYHSQLASTLALKKIKKGEAIGRKSNISKSIHFLVDGTVEIRQSFDNRISINHESSQCQHSLESQVEQRGSIKATEDCTLLLANIEKLDEFLASSQELTMTYLDEEHLSLETEIMIDDDFHEDWDDVFIRSPLAANLPSTTIHQLFSQLDDTHAELGESIVKSHSMGDYFYVIKHGTAEVQTASKGPFKGITVELTAGSYFGDEALVANTVRNASVTMLTDGILGRLDIEAFDSLIKQHLVTPVTRKIFETSKKIKIIDVRLPIEYRNSHREGSENIPISALRHEMKHLQPSIVYIVFPDSDSRSELATYLLRQAGFQAYQWSESITSEQHET